MSGNIVEDITKGKNIFTLRTGVLVSAVGMFSLFVYNYYMSSGKQYMMSDGSGAYNLTPWIMDNLATYLPLVGSAILGIIVKALGGSPEFVKAAQDLAKHPNVVEIEKRFIMAVLERITPLLGKYPEIFINILSSMAPSFKDDPEVIKAINVLGQALVRYVFKTEKEDAAKKLV